MLSKFLIFFWVYGYGDRILVYFCRMLEILYQDDNLVAINKPNGLLVHRSFYARDANQFAIQELRNQLGGQHVYPVHRLDRKTSGVLLFALDRETLVKMNEIFANRDVVKKYYAIVRGYAPAEMTIDYALKNEEEQIQNAVTHFKTLKYAEINLPFGRHLTSRYSFVEAIPETGRMHQLRKHFKHILHPILGSRPHGCNKQNKLWLENYGLTEMLLHAHSLEFLHPYRLEKITINAPMCPAFNKVMNRLGIKQLTEM